MQPSHPRPEASFLCIGLIAGAAFALLTPALNGADEPAHWQRAVQVSEGGWRAVRRGDEVGGLLPRFVQEVHAATTAAPSPAGDSATDRVFVDFRRTAVFAPLAYAPQALAIRLASALGMRAPHILYAARLAGLAASLALAYTAIRIAPVGTHLLLLLALTPMAIRQMSVLTADSITNGAALLLLALCLRLALDRRRPVSPAGIAQVIGCSLVVSLTKTAYAPLALLVLMCPVERLGGQRRYAAIVGAMLLLNLVAVGLWLWASRDLYVAQPLAPDADPPRQLAFILADPLRFVHVMRVTLHAHWDGYLGAATGFAGTRGAPPAGLGWAYLAIAALIAAFDARRDRALAWRAKLSLCGAVAATYVLVNALNYMGWNAVGAATIELVQGRYFLPLLPPLFLLLSNRRLAGRVALRHLALASTAAATLSAAVAVRYLVLRWYGV